MPTSTPYQAQRTALEQITLHESYLIRKQRDEEWRYKKEEGDQWFADQIEDLQAWHDYLVRRHNIENRKTLIADDDPLGDCPRSKPFPRYLAMLGDQAAGEDFCDEARSVLIEISLIIAMQTAIGVMIGDRECQLRRILKSCRSSVQSTEGSGGSSTATLAVKPPRNRP